MCGRYTLKTPLTEIFQQITMFRLSTCHSDLSHIHPRYNIAPGQRVLVIRGASLEGEQKQASHNSLQISEMKWGRSFVSGKKQQSIINTRLETLEQKQHFQAGMNNTIRPCLIIADGYYEWQNSSNGKIPVYIYRKDNRLLLFAGTWQSAHDAKNTLINSCTIVTCPASGRIGRIHDRMPLFTDPPAGMDWLTCSTALARCRCLLKPCLGDALQDHTVHTRVNRVDF